MHWNTDAWLTALGRVTLMVAVSAGLVALLLAGLRVRSASLQRLAWAIVLLQGWLIVQVPIQLEREAVPRPEPIVMSDTTRPTTPRGDGDVAIPIAETQYAAEAPALASSQTDVITVPSTDSVTAAADTNTIPWTMYLFAIWISGAVLFPIVGVYRYASFLGLMQSADAPTTDWQAEFTSARSALGVTGHVALRIADDVGPCLVRRRRESCVVVPRSLWSELTPVQRLAILRHELAHFVRGDLWKSMAMRLLAVPQWFNPAAWWAVRRFDECAEWACDEVAAGDGAGTTEYSKLLLSLGTAPARRTAYLPAAHTGCVATRIRRLVAEPRRDLRAAKVLVPLVVVGLTALNLLRIDVVAQSASSTRNAARPKGAVGARVHMPWHPDELVAVLGEERGTLWSYADHLVITRDGRRLIANAGQSSLFIYDTDTLGVIATFGERRVRLLSAALSQDGSRLIAGYGDGAMTVWNIEGDEPVLEQTVNVMPPGLEDAYLSYTFALQADRVVISTAHKPVMLWELDANRLRQVLSFELDGDGYHAAILPDGQRIVTTYTIPPGDPIPPERIVEINGVRQIRMDCRLQLWDVSGRQATELDELTTGDLWIGGVTPEGQRLFGTSRTEPTPLVRFVSLGGGKLIEQTPASLDLDRIFRPAFRPDGRVLAVVTRKKELQLVDTSAGNWRAIATLDSASVVRLGVTFSPDGHSLYVTAGSVLQRWDRTDNDNYIRVSPQSAHSSHVSDLLFGSSGDSLMAASDEAICDWDLSRLESPERDVHDVTLTPFGSTHLARWSRQSGVLFHISRPFPFNGIGLWDVSRHEASPAFQISFGDNYRDDAWCFKLRPDGKVLATGHWDYAIRFWILDGRAAPRMVAELSHAHDGHVCDLAYSPDGSMLASVSFDRSVKLWDTSTDPPSIGGELGKHEAIVRSVVFSPDARWLASGDEDGVIRLWDLKSADLSGPTIRHPADLPGNAYIEQRTVNTLTFSADSSRLLSADGAGRVTVWSVPSGEVIKEWRFPGWVWVARWSPDERLIATGNQNGTVYLLAAPE